MTREISTVCTKCGKRPAKDGNKICGLCIGNLKRSYPNVRRNIIEQETEIEARRLIRELIEANEVQIEIREWDKDFNPFDALLEIAQEQMAWKDICLAKLAKLKAEEWRWDGDRAGEQLRSEITLYERSIDRAMKTMERIARLGIEERMMRIAERQAAIVETAIVRTLQELDLPVDLQAKARHRIILHLKSS